jgi:hypothetical protein
MDRNRQRYQGKAESLKLPHARIVGVACVGFKIAGQAWSSRVAIS